MDWDIVAVVAVVAAGLSVFLFVIAVAWPRKWRPDTVEDVHWKDKELWDLFQERQKLIASGVLPKVELGPDDTVPSVLQSAVDRRGKHLRTD